VHILLHVLDGYLSEIEVYRPDGELLQQVPEPSSLAIKRSYQTPTAAP
jgi:hypothetical protein